MKYNFDQVIDRRNSGSLKWDELENYFGMKDAIPMWVADMDFASPPEVVHALSKRAEHGVFGYPFRPESYLDAIVEWLTQRHRWTIDKQWLSHSPGVVPSLSVIVNTFTNPGDKVVVQSPVYHNFFRLIEAQGRKIVDNPLMLINGRYTMDFDDLEAQLDPSVKMIILCSPHNPVGRVWSPEELTRLGQICIKHNILVVVDEIHCDLVYNNHTHLPYASLSAAFAEQSITCIAPSKTFNLLGLHTSSVIIPNPELRDRFNKAMEGLSMNAPNTFGVIALESAYRYGGEWLDQLLIYLRENVQLVKRFMEERIPQIKVIEPEATYLVWLDCREWGLTREELDQLFIQHARVAVNQGYSFGANGEGFMRMNVACPRSVLVQALKQIEDAVIIMGR